MKESKSPTRREANLVISQIEIDDFHLDFPIVFYPVFV